MNLKVWFAQILIFSLWMQMLSPALAQENQVAMVPLVQRYKEIKALEKKLKEYTNTLITGEGSQLPINAVYVCTGVSDAKGELTWYGRAAQVTGKLSALEELSKKLKESLKDLNHYGLVIDNTQLRLSKFEEANKTMKDTATVNISTGAQCKLVSTLDEFQGVPFAEMNTLNESLLQPLNKDLENKANIKKQDQLQTTLTEYPNCKKYYDIVVSARKDAINYRDAIVAYNNELKKRVDLMTQLKARLGTVSCGNANPVIMAKPSGQGLPIQVAEMPDTALSGGKKTPEEIVPTSLSTTGVGNPPMVQPNAEKTPNQTLVDPGTILGAGPQPAPATSLGLGDAELPPPPPVGATSGPATPTTAATAVFLKGGDEASVATAPPAAATPPSTPLSALPVLDSGGSGGGGGSQVAATPSPSGGGAPESSAGTAPPASSAAGGDTQEGSSSWGSALKIGLGVAAVGALGVGGYMLYKSQQDSKEKKSSSSRSIASSTSASTGTDTSAEADGALIDELATLAQAAKANMAAATSKQSYQDIASGFTSEAASKLSAIGVTTQVEQSTSGSGFTHSYLKLISATEGVGQATANRLFASEVYDPLSGASEPSL